VQLQRNGHRSQNRIESYHQLRAAIAQVGGKKELTGRTDIEIEISNQCARLVANTIIYYNSAILSQLLAKYGVAGNAKALAVIKKISPVAWRHIRSVMTEISRVPAYPPHSTSFPERCASSPFARASISQSRRTSRAVRCEP
jgi:hypothetical protein